jgi:guanosine-3',5'-bis(diphosphate) 3'-pyrophosphohydrolase
LHTGLRKDGITPSFHHQISIANYITTLPLDSVAMEKAVTLAFLHDTPEDKGVSYEEIQSMFGSEIANGAILLAKKYRGHDIPKEKYFTDLATDAMVALVKGADRMNNLSTMHGVFTDEKQGKYVDETLECHLPMLKNARRNFPEYHMAFENVKIGIIAWVNATQNYLKAVKENKS